MPDWLAIAILFSVWLLVFVMPVALRWAWDVKEED